MQNVYVFLSAAQPPTPRGGQKAEATAPSSCTVQSLRQRSFDTGTKSTLREATIDTIRQSRRSRFPDTQVLILKIYVKPQTIQNNSKRILYALLHTCRSKIGHTSAVIVSNFHTQILEQLNLSH